MMTYERFKAAFSNEEQRDAFFGADGRSAVPYGTAMTHVLGINLGIFGDREMLRRDAARIMMCELDAYADAAGEERLDLPVAAVMNCSLFAEAFRACARFNADETEEAMTALRMAANPGMKNETSDSHVRIRAEDDPAIAHCRSEAFVGELYEALAPLVVEYRREMANHRDSLARIGVL